MTKNNPPFWTKEKVEVRFQEAADTLYRLPKVLPHPRLTIWPPILRDFYERLTEVQISIQGPPSPQAIDEMDETLTWFLYVDPYERNLIWLRANKVRWRPLALHLRLHRQTLWRHWVKALEKIAQALNHKKSS